MGDLDRNEAENMEEQENVQNMQDAEVEQDPLLAGYRPEEFDLESNYDEVMSYSVSQTDQVEPLYKKIREAAEREVLFDYQEELRRSEYKISKLEEQAGYLKEMEEPYDIPDYTEEQIEGYRRIISKYRDQKKEAGKSPEEKNGKAALEENDLDVSDVTDEAVELMESDIRQHEANKLYKQYNLLKELRDMQQYQVDFLQKGKDIDVPEGIRGDTADLEDEVMNRIDSRGYEVMTIVKDNVIEKTQEAVSDDVLDYRFNPRPFDYDRQANVGNEMSGFYARIQNADSKEELMGILDDFDKESPSIRKTIEEEMKSRLFDRQVRRNLPAEEREKYEDIPVDLPEAEQEIHRLEHMVHTLESDPDLAGVKEFRQVLDLGTLTQEQVQAHPRRAFDLAAEATVATIMNTKFEKLQDLRLKLEEKKAQVQPEWEKVDELVSRRFREEKDNLFDTALEKYDILTEQEKHRERLEKEHAEREAARKEREKLEREEAEEREQKEAEEREKQQKEKEKEAEARRKANEERIRREDSEREARAYEAYRAEIEARKKDAEGERQFREQIEREKREKAEAEKRRQEAEAAARERWLAAEQVRIEEELRKEREAAKSRKEPEPEPAGRSYTLAELLGDEAEESMPETVPVEAEEKKNPENDAYMEGVADLFDLVEKEMNASVAEKEGQKAPDAEEAPKEAEKAADAPKEEKKAEPVNAPKEEKKAESVNAPKEEKKAEPMNAPKEEKKAESVNAPKEEKKAEPVNIPAEAKSAAVSAPKEAVKPEADNASLVKQFLDSIYRMIFDTTQKEREKEAALRRETIQRARATAREENAKNANQIEGVADLFEQEDRKLSKQENAKNANQIEGVADLFEQEDRKLSKQENAKNADQIEGVADLFAQEDRKLSKQENAKNANQIESVADLFALTEPEAKEAAPQGPEPQEKKPDQAKKTYPMAQASEAQQKAPEGPDRKAEVRQKMMDLAEKVQAAGNTEQQPEVQKGGNVLRQLRQIRDNMKKTEGGYFGHSNTTEYTNMLKELETVCKNADDSLTASDPKLNKLKDQFATYLNAKSKDKAWHESGNIRKDNALAGLNILDRDAAAKYVKEANQVRSRRNRIDMDKLMLQTADRQMAVGRTK